MSALSLPLPLQRPDAGALSRLVLQIATVVLLIDALFVVPMPWTVQHGPTHLAFPAGDATVVAPLPSTTRATLANSLRALVVGEQQLVGTVAETGTAPSSDTSFALALLAADPTGEVLADVAVGAIGRIGPDGRVAAVDGLPAHVALALEAGVELLLVPNGQLEEARAMAPEGVTVRGVRSTETALAQITSYRAQHTSPRN